MSESPAKRIGRPPGTKNKPGHNAGRPPRGDVARIHVYLTSAARRRVKTEAKWRGLSVSEYVESLILAKPEPPEEN